jgi:hypothetical protein
MFTCLTRSLPLHSVSILTYVSLPLCNHIWTRTHVVYLGAMVQRAKDVAFKTLWDKHKTYKRFASKFAMEFVHDEENVRWLPQAIKLRVFPTDSTEDAPEAHTEDDNEGGSRVSSIRSTKCCC